MASGSKYGADRGLVTPQRRHRLLTAFSAISVRYSLFGPSVSCSGGSRRGSSNTVGTQQASQGLSENGTGCAQISMMARSTVPHSRAGS